MGQVNNVGMWNGFIWLRVGPVEGCCIHGSEPLRAVKDGELFTGERRPTVTSVEGCCTLELVYWSYGD